jgi:hypothetical protein
MYALPTQVYGWMSLHRPFITQPSRSNSSFVTAGLTFLMANIDAQHQQVFFALKPGTDVMITIFCDF